MRYFTLFIVMHFLCQFSLVKAQQKLGFNDTHSKFGDQMVSFALKNDSLSRRLIELERIPVKHITSEWIFVTQSPNWIKEHTELNHLTDFYLELSKPMALSDTARVAHHVVPVHQGTGGLTSSFHGKDVLIGIVDQGLDWNHPDFKDSLGRSRVLRYWDQTLSSGSTIPQPYNYGIVWDSASINNQTCFSTESSTAHGTTVTGAAAGNGRANGTNTGMAPEADIIVVETNFSAPNWTLTVADAVDYIFKVADSLNKPAVVNLSLGTYLGSHDGNDPASEWIEDLLEEKEGRIVVCAAGNSGNKGKYHVHADIDQDTSFVWFVNNPSPSAYFGANKIYFDLWTDSIDATFNFAYGADTPDPSYQFRGQTNFRSAQNSLNGVYYDTIYSTSGNRIATIETYTEVVGGAFHLGGYFSGIDSTSYLFRFMTTGSGNYDIWSGSWLGFNNMISQPPSNLQVPSIIHYNYPDTLQTIVSSWNCSEKVISVGNVRNRMGHIDANGNYYTTVNDPSLPGQLSLNSSKGPNRHLVTKPDVCASGDVSMGSAPLWFLSNPANNSIIDSGGWHARNGGTSMSSPVVAGIAALYLEKCPRATYIDFKNDLIQTAFEDNFTGILPNNAYGFGKPHALNLMLTNNFQATIVGDDTLCDNTGQLSIQSSVPISFVEWSNGQVGIVNTINGVGTYSALTYNNQGCLFQTADFEVIQESPLPMLPIVQSGNTLATLSLTNYQWTLNGVDIPGANSSTLTIYPPYGVYSCYCTNSAGCISSTEPFSPLVGLTGDFEENIISIYPNPVIDVITLATTEEVDELRVIDASGRILLDIKDPGFQLDLSELETGNYLLQLCITGQFYYSKIAKL